MAFIYAGKNRRPFTAVCKNTFGRKMIKTNALVIDDNNILSELSKALVTHQQNQIECEYLNRYYEGDQPILYKEKKVRPEINNKVVVNLAYYIVETHTAEISGEPIQYVLRGTDDSKAEQINKLNTIMEGEDKAYYDIELCRWRSICGTSYRFIDKGMDRLLDESDISLSVESPMDTFVCYYNNGKPAFSCQIREDEEGKTVYYLYTQSKWYVTNNDGILEQGINGNGAIPVIEYPNNARRLSDIEITILLTDQQNKFASDRSDGLDQFVQSFIKFINCEIDEETFRKLRETGALAVKSNNGDNRADVEMMSQELNQSQSQVAVDDNFEKILVIQGIANRQGNTGGDSQGAVVLRNGHYDAEKRAELGEPIFKKSERDMLRIILNRLRITQGFTLLPSDIDIKISRSKMDNMQVKAQTLQMLLASGINPEVAIKVVGLFSDPEQVATDSKARMDILYPTEKESEVVSNDNEQRRTEQSTLGTNQ